MPRSKWLGCEPEAIRIAGSKRATRERLGSAGIAVPEAASAAGRCIAKPDDGAGATDTRVFESLAAAAQAADGITIESFVDGEPLSLSLLCERGRAELLAVNRQRIDIDADGVVSFRGVDIAIEPVDAARGQRLRRLAARVADALPGLFGFVGIDVVWHAQRGPVRDRSQPAADHGVCRVVRAAGAQPRRRPAGAASPCVTTPSSAGTSAART